MPPKSRTGYNNLVLEAYPAGSTTRVADPDNALARAQALSFDTFYPGGLFGPMQFFVQRDVSRSWFLGQGQRLIIRNGSPVVWEGAIVHPGYLANPQQMGRQVNGDGYWGQTLGLRGWRRPWADQRLTPDVWVEQTGATAAQKTTLNRQSQIKFVPKAVPVVNGDLAAVRFTAPTGMTVQRVKWTWTMAGTNINAALYNVGTAANEVLINAVGGPTARDDTLGTPSQSVELRWITTASRTPAGDGSEHVTFTSVTIYCGGTANVTATQVVTDWISRLAGAVTSDQSRIGSNTLALEPWLTGLTSCDYEMAAANLARVASLGDASFNAWACYLTEAENNSAVPVLNYAQQPALSAYDYAIRLTDQTLNSLGLNETDIFNYLIVSYRDQNGSINWVTPDDDAALKDAASITAWGQNEKILTGNFTSLAAAKNYAKRFLSSNKDRHFYASQPIPIKGFITSPTGNVPASLIRAGKRVKIISNISDEIGIVGAGLTFMISRTHYDDPSETCQISCGLPDNLAVMIARLQAGVA